MVISNLFDSPLLVIHTAKGYPKNTLICCIMYMNWVFVGQTKEAEPSEAKKVISDIYHLI